MPNLNKTMHLFLSNMPDLKDKHVVAGFSGGADSTALLHLLNEKKDFFKFHLHAVFFSHGNSPIAQDEDKMLEFCQLFCEERKIHFIEQPLNLEKIPRQGWESSGRKGRLAFYQEAQFDWVFLGHHKDDQNETTMIQLMRGGGKGASGMKKIDGMFCRPLLDHAKKDLYDYLNEQEVGWVEDPTNINTDFTRNFWRNKALPLIAQHYPDYSQMLDNFRSRNSELNDLASELAYLDGLNELQNGELINIESLSPKRLKNLIAHYFNTQGKYMEDNYFEQQVSHYMANKNLTIEHKGVELYLQKGFITKNLMSLPHLPHKRKKI